MLKSRLKSRKTFTYLAVIGLLIFLHFTKILVPVESFLVGILNPVFKTMYSGGADIRDVYGNQTDKREYSAVIDKLEKENRRLIAENAKLNTLKDENNFLSKQINFRKENNYNLLLANIVSRNDLMNNSSEEKSIIINKGTKDGIVNGLIVLDSEGVVVGKIIEARDTISRACLSIDRKCKFAASIQNTDRTSGVVEGELGLTIKMDLIPQTEELEKGNIIVTSGLENNIPRGLAIGRISEVIKENNSLWQKAVVDPIVNFDNLVMVSVILPE